MRQPVSTSCKSKWGLAVKKHEIRLFLGLAASPFLSSPTFAGVVDLGTVMSSLSGQMTIASTLITIIAFVSGVVMAIIGILKFKAYSQNPNDPQAKLSSAFVYIFAGAAMVALPSTIMTGVATFFGTNAQVTNAVSGF